MPVYNPQDSTGGDWTCPQCGAFVPLNTSHSCPIWNTQPVYTVTYPPASYVSLLERIAAALEKIAANFEKKGE